MSRCVMPLVKSWKCRRNSTTFQLLLIETLLGQRFRKSIIKFLMTPCVQLVFFGYENEWWDYRDTQMDDYPPAKADPMTFKSQNIVTKKLELTC